MGLWKQLFGKKDDENAREIASSRVVYPSKSSSSQPTKETHPPFVPSTPDFPSYKANDDLDLRDRVIRVFISSTFRDMMRERDHLVKEVFPALRRICAKRFVTFTEVDLRWGITEEQAAEGKVLPLCLAEIERSRPYFIGLLGERYGWIPDAIPAEVIEKEPWLKEHLHGRKSVTELEDPPRSAQQPGDAGTFFLLLPRPGLCWGQFTYRRGAAGNDGAGHSR